MQLFKHEDSIYHVKVIVTTGDINQFKKYVQKQFGIEIQTTRGDSNSDFNGVTHGFKSFDTGEIIYVIWIRSWKNTIDNVRTLSHELLHVTNRAMIDLGWTFDALNDEPFVYFYEDLFGDMYNQIVKWYFNKSNKRKRVSNGRGR